jgi:hypothetical protein
MAKQRVKFTFAPDLIKEPVIWRLGRDFDVVTNIRRADVADDRGWVVCQARSGSACRMSLARMIGVRRL